MNRRWDVGEHVGGEWNGGVRMEEGKELWMDCVALFL